MGAGLVSESTMSAEPSPRRSHFSAAVGDQLYVWGGVTKDYSKKKNALASALHSFHSVLECWEHCECSGPLPPALYEGCCASTGDQLYMYGGRDGSAYQGCLYQLDPKSRKWQQLSSDGPMRKIGCRMVIYGRKLVLFGGYGIPSDPTQPGAQFIKNAIHNDGISVWTNELHIFDLEEGVCVWYECLCCFVFLCEVCICVCLCVYVCLLVFIYVCVFVYVRVCLHMCLFTCVFVYVCMFVYMCVCVCVC